MQKDLKDVKDGIFCRARAIAAQREKEMMDRATAAREALKEYAGELEGAFVQEFSEELPLFRADGIVWETDVTAIGMPMAVFFKKGEKCATIECKFMRFGQAKDAHIFKWKLCSGGGGWGDFGTASKDDFYCFLYQKLA